jgi:hypothetical protein
MKPNCRPDQATITDKVRLFEETFKVVVAVTTIKEKADLRFENRKRA